MRLKPGTAAADPAGRAVQRRQGMECADRHQWNWWRYRRIHRCGIGSRVSAIIWWTRRLYRAANWSGGIVWWRCLFRLEAGPGPADLVDLVDEIIGWFRQHPDYETLKQLFTEIVGYALSEQAGFANEQTALPANDLLEMRDMVPERFKRWADEVRAKTLADVLPGSFAASSGNCRQAAPNGFTRLPARNWTHGWIGWWTPLRLPTFSTTSGLIDDATTRFTAGLLRRSRQWTAAVDREAAA